MWVVLRNTSSELVEVPSEVVAGRWRRRRGTPTSSPNPFATSWMSFGIIVATLVATCALILRQRQRDATIAPRIPIRTWPLVINPRNRELGGRENASSGCTTSQPQLRFARTPAVSQEFCRRFRKKCDDLEKM
jgi:hypothetical protein